MDSSYYTAHVTQSSKTSNPIDPLTDFVIPRCESPESLLPPDYTEPSIRVRPIPPRMAESYARKRAKRFQTPQNKIDWNNFTYRVPDTLITSKGRRSASSDYRYGSGLGESNYNRNWDQGNDENSFRRSSWDRSCDFSRSNPYNYSNFHHDTLYNPQSLYVPYSDQDREEERDTFSPTSLLSGPSKTAGTATVSGGGTRTLTATKAWDNLEVNVRGEGNTVVNVNLENLDKPTIKMDCSEAKGRTKFSINLKYPLTQAAPYYVEPGDVITQDEWSITARAWNHPPVPQEFKSL